MTKLEFTTELQQRLSSLPENEQQKIMAYYEEMIDDRMEDGMNEERAVDGLGTLDDIVKQSMLGMSLPVLIKARVNDSTNNNHTLKLILIIAGSPIWASLLLAGVCVAFGLYVTVWSVLVSIYAVVLSLAVPALAGVVAFVVNLCLGRVALGFILLGLGFICAGIAVVAYQPSINLGKYLVKSSVKLLNMIKLAIIKRRGNNE